MVYIWRGSLSYVHCSVIRKTFKPKSNVIFVVSIAILQHHPLRCIFHLALILPVPQEVAVGTNTRRASTDTRISKVLQAIAIGSGKQRLDHSVDESLHHIKTVDKLGSNDTWQVVCNGGEEEAGRSRWSEGSQISSQWNEIVETLILSWNSELGAAQDQIGDVGSSSFERVWSRAAVPLTREGLVEIERSDVCEVGVEGVGAVGKSAEDEDALGGGDC